MKTNTVTDQNINKELWGAKLIKALHYIINTVRIHQDNNQLIKEGFTQFSDIINDLPDAEDINIQIWRGRFHVQGERLLYRRENFQLINEVLEYFAQRKIGGLRFRSTIKNVSADDFITFIRLLNDCVKNNAPADWLNQQLQASGLAFVEVTRKQKEKPQNLHLTSKERARHAYSNALSIVKEVADKASRGVTGVRKARRLAQMVVDLVQEDKTLIMGLATIKEYDDYTYTHSVNVALLATCLGRYLGMSSILLEYLAVCGLFHDLGKVGVAKDILLKQSKLDENEWNKMKSHPLIGVKNILRLQAPQALKSRIILGPFEHHLNPDLSGYPQTHFVKTISLMGKILRIVDVYEALTSERIYRSRPYSPDEALRRMWSEGKNSFDLPLLKSFINMMGIYPVGSILQLASGELGLVMDYPDESDKSSPLLLLLVDDGKGSWTRGELLNLADGYIDNPQRGEIIRGLHSSILGIQPSEFFLQETET